MTRTYLNYYLQEQLYRLNYLLITFCWFFQLYYNYQTELLYLLTTNLRYTYFITNNAFELFTINILVAFFCTLLTIPPYILLQYFLYQKSTYTKTHQEWLQKKLCFIVVYFYGNLYLIVKHLTPFFWNLLLSFEEYNEKILLELTPKIANYFQFLTTIYVINITSHFIMFGLFFIAWTTALPPSVIQLLFTRKLIYPFITITFSFATPPDLFSLLIILIPALIIYETFLLTLLAVKKK